MIRTSNRDQLKDHAGQDVEHGSKRGIDEGDDWSSTEGRFLLLGKDLAGGHLSSLSDGPRVSVAMGVDQV